MPLDTPTYPQYTNLALGEGVFDQLMATVKAHLKQEFDADRIDQSEWGKVYLGSLEAVLGNSTQYLLGIMLIDEKREQLQLQSDLIELQKEELRYRIDYLLPLERDRLQHEIDKLAVEILRIEAEILRINAEVIYLGKQGELIDSQITLHTAQISKINKEIELLTAKITTEQANTQAGVAATGSLIGHQQALLKAQKLGFAGDLKSKLAKLYADYDAVVESVNENGTADLSTAATTIISDAMALSNTIEAIP